MFRLLAIKSLQSTFRNGDKIQFYFFAQLIPNWVVHYNAWFLITLTLFNWYHRYDICSSSLYLLHSNQNLLIVIESRPLELCEMLLQCSCRQSKMTSFIACRQGGRYTFFSETVAIRCWMHISWHLVWQKKKRHLLNQSVAFGVSVCSSFQSRSFIIHSFIEIANSQISGSINANFAMRQCERKKNVRLQSLKQKRQQEIAFSYNKWACDAKHIVFIWFTEHASHLMQHHSTHFTIAPFTEWVENMLFVSVHDDRVIMATWQVYQ